MKRILKELIKSARPIFPMVALGTGLLAGLEPASALPPRADDAGETLTPAAAIQPDWWNGVTAQIRHAEYDVSRNERGLQAPNRANDMRTYFLAGGIELVSRSHDDEAELTWQTSSWGRWNRLAAIAPHVREPHEKGDHVVYTRAGLEEWYENGPAGLEQGFTVQERPRGEGPLVLMGRIGGGLHPTLRAGEETVAFTDETGREVLRYGNLHVFDADGDELTSHLEVHGNEVAIVVNDQHAPYPLTIDPLFGAPAWTTDGNQDGAEFGFQCSTAGDVNGDGFSDVIVSAPYFDAGENDEGRIFVYRGSRDGLASTPAWTAEINQEGAAFGSTVAPAGDVNADGYSDILAGTWRYDNDHSAAGVALLYLGSASGLGASPAWTVEGERELGAVGMSLATAGDVNGDGYSDVVIGALHFGSSHDSGHTLVYHGSASGLPVVPSWIKHVNAPGEGAFGWSVSTAGDVNGDGFSDIIVGSAAGGNPDGAVYVYHGSPSGLFTDHAWRKSAPQTSSNFGYSVATAGDVDGDGFSDVIIGAEQYDNSALDEGAAYVYHGSDGGLSTNPAWFAFGGQAGARFGDAVSPAGDVNGDGFADILVGAWKFDNGQVDEGRAVLYLGSSSGLTASPVWNTEGDQTHAYLGRSVATAGDVNGDGFSDMLVGAFGYGEDDSWEGRAMLFHGAAGGLSTSASWAAESDQANAHFGHAVASAGDVNADGYSDVVVAAPDFDNGQLEEGRVFGYYGSYLGLPFSVRWATESNQGAALLGWKKGLASAGDVNGDGYDDLIVGAPLFDNGEENEGKVSVFHGSTVGLGGFAAWTAEPNQADAAFGISVASAGDVNGDGYADVIIGADPSVINGNSIGHAYVYNGSATGLSTTPAWTIAADQPGSGFGASVAGAGDVNGDGYSDVIVGAPDYDHGANEEGRAFVYLGGPSGLATSPAWSAESNQALARFGTSVATAGDVNGDGFSDVIVGAGQFDNGEMEEGRAFVYYGSATGLEPSAAWTTESNQANAGFLIAVASAGDVNADGLSDVVVGFHEYDNGQTGEGIARVFLGSTSGLATEHSWQIESNQNGANLGFAVAAAGDVNADGFGDVIVSAIDYTSTASQTNEGAAYVYYGNERGGLEKVPSQARADESARIAPLGRSDSLNSFRLRAYARTAAGRGRVRLEYELKPLGEVLDGSGLAIGSVLDTGFPTGAGSAVQISELVSGLTPMTLFHWRARIVSDSPFFPRSPWFTLADNASNEGDVRGGGTVSSVDGIDGDGKSTRFLAPSVNPFHGALKIAYTLPESGRVRLTVHDVRGRQVALLRDEIQNRGGQSASWNAGESESMPAGVYYVRLAFGDQVDSQKVVFVR